MQATSKNEVQDKKSEISKRSTLLARPIYPGTPGQSLVEPEEAITMAQ